MLVAGSDMTAPAICPVLSAATMAVWSGMATILTSWLGTRLFCCSNWRRSRSLVGLAGEEAEATGLGAAELTAGDAAPDLLLAGASDATEDAIDGPALVPAGALEPPHADKVSTATLPNAVRNRFNFMPFV